MPRNITVKIAQLASNLKTITVQDGASMKEVLKKARMTPTGDVYVNGKRAGMATPVHQGDIIGIVGQVDGG